MKTLLTAFILGASLGLAHADGPSPVPADAPVTTAPAPAAAPLAKPESTRPEPTQHARARGRSLPAGDLRECLKQSNYAAVIRCAEGRR